VHDAEHVAERVDDRRGDEAGVAARGERLVVAPMASSVASVPATSSTCQFMIAPPGVPVAAAGAYFRSTKPSSSSSSPTRNSMYAGAAGASGNAKYGSRPSSSVYQSRAAARSSA